MAVVVLGSSWRVTRTEYTSFCLKVRACLPHITCRGIRQRLYKLWKDHDWQNKYNAMIGDGSDVPGGYSEHLASSKFCVVAPGVMAVHAAINLCVATETTRVRLPLHVCVYGSGGGGQLGMYLKNGPQA